MAFGYNAPQAPSLSWVHDPNFGGTLNVYQTPYGGSPGGISGSTGGLSSWASNPLAAYAQQGPNIEPYVSQNANMANWLQGAFAGNLDYAEQALKLAFDPQQALFKQRQQDLIDATRAGEAARGIAVSPYGAGVEANAIGRFYNDWQNEQVQRMYVGTQAATGLQKTYADAVVSAAQIRDNLIKDQLQAYGLKGEMLNNAMSSVLQALDLEARVAMAGLDSQTRKDVATISGSAQVASAGISAAGGVQQSMIQAASKGGK